MKKNLDKFLMVFIISLFLVVGLTGCGKKDNNYSVKGGEDNNAGGLSIEEIIGKTKEISEIKYDFVTNVPQGGNITTTIAKKGNKTKIETDMNGMKSAYYIDSEKKVAYTYLNEQNMAIETDFNETEEILNDSPANRMETFETDGAKIVGTEKIEGKKCQIIEALMGLGGVKVWIWEENGLPLRTEMDGPGGKMIVELKNIKTKVDDSEVELPKNAKIMETSGLDKIPDMQNMDMNNIPGI
ncbi:hypothetical protein K8R62_03320 [bacterium]|nr:hypothetical protein [bacterium]